MKPIASVILNCWNCAKCLRMFILNLRKPPCFWRRSTTKLLPISRNKSKSCKNRRAGKQSHKNLLDNALFVLASNVEGKYIVVSRFCIDLSWFLAEMGSSAQYRFPIVYVTIVMIRMSNVNAEWRITNILLRLLKIALKQVLILNWFMGTFQIEYWSSLSQLLAKQHFWI